MQSHRCFGFLSPQPDDPHPWTASGVNGAVSQHALEAVVAAGKPGHVRVAILDLLTVVEGVLVMTGKNEPATTTGAQVGNDLFLFFEAFDNFSSRFFCQ